ncbi:MAG: phosphoglycerate kinase [Bacilli bacterium]|nr:phosphoglycerate kinase [Bacilli bacterium]
MQMTTLFLVRHGIKEKAIGDVPLLMKGIEQAQMTATYFETKPIKHVYSSPLTRAKETANFIGLRFGLPIVVDNRLKERTNWGDLPGQTFEEFVDMWDKCSRDRQYVPPVGDSAQQAGERLESFMQDVCAKLIRIVKLLRLLTEG